MHLKIVVSHTCIVRQITFNIKYGARLKWRHILSVDGDAFDDRTIVASFGPEHVDALRGLKRERQW